jgi:hypothetical protein
MLYLMRTEGVLLIECVTRIERVCVRCGGKGGLSVDLERVACACGCSEDVMVCVCVCACKDEKASCLQVSCSGVLLIGDYLTNKRTNDLTMDVCVY